MDRRGRIKIYTLILPLLSIPVNSFLCYTRRCG
jgi:hypothetical protein